MGNINVAIGAVSVSLESRRTTCVEWSTKASEHHEAQFEVPVLVKLR